MGILRADLLTHSQLPNEGGSIVLDGSGDYLSFAAHSAFSPATSDVTFELWFYLNAESDFTEDSADSNYYFFDMGSNGYRIQMYSGLLRFGIDGSTWTPPASGVSKTTWHHVAGVRQSNSLDLYLDGKHVGQKSTTASVTTTSLTIGQYGGNLSYNGVPHGYISNFRYVRGVVYNGEFTPPKFELKNIPGTIVLGCQSTSSATDFAVTPSTISVGGNTAASTFHPSLKKDITDTGVVFDGFGSFATSTYMVPPSGKTADRGRGRMLIGGGGSYPSENATIYSINIQSQGNTVVFGDLTQAREGTAAVSSVTRAVFGGGGNFGAPDYNILDYVEFATTGNALDFGDLNYTARETQGTSNETRGVIAGGYFSPSNSNSDTMDYITIASVGNATDFGNLTTAWREGHRGIISNGSRGIFGSGVTPSFINNIDFITIATTGNATDFGDLLNAGRQHGGACSTTRGVFAGEDLSPSGGTNTIQFITIATTGNAIDFGDMSVVGGQHAGGSNKIRGVFAGGTTPSSPYAINSIEFITIATTGNSQDFGDINEKLSYAGAASDCHGGLS